MIVFWAAPHAGAQAATAEASYQQGMALMQKGDYLAACPKLDESFRQVPATAALLALATCHERQGRLVAAWTEYTDVAYRFTQEGQQASAAAVRRSADALYPRLSQLTLRVPADASAVQGVEVRRDGLVVEPAAWGTSVPVEAGQHRIDVSAPGRESWSTTIAIGPEGDRRTVEVPVFRSGSAWPSEASRGRSPAGIQASGSETAPSSTRLTTLQTAGVATGGVGVLALAFGVYFAVSAINGKADSNADCTNNICNSAESLQTRQDAVRDGNLATLASVTGVILIGTGATMFVLGRSGPSDSRPQARLTPRLGARDVGVVLSGSF